MATWLHDLRNAFNAVSTNALVVQRLLEEGNTERAMAFNTEVLNACERCRVLLESTPAGSGDDPG